MVLRHLVEIQSQQVKAAEQIKFGAQRKGIKERGLHGITGNKFS